MTLLARYPFQASVKLSWICWKCLTENQETQILTAKEDGKYLKNLREKVNKIDQISILDSGIHQ